MIKERSVEEFSVVKKRTNTQRIFFLLFFLLVLSPFSPALAAQTESADDPWVKSLEAISPMLQEGRWQDAKTAADQLLVSLTHAMRTSDGAARLFALATLYRALGHAGLGELREARWDWHIVFELDPTLATRAGLEPFGDAGAFLAKYRSDPKTRETASLYADRPVAVGGAGDKGLTPAQIVSSPQPAFPSGLEGADRPYLVVGRILVGIDGLPRRAVIENSPGSVFTFAVLNVAKAWTFSPAVLDGHKIVMPTPFSVDFKRQVPSASP